MTAVASPGKRVTQPIRLWGRRTWMIARTPFLALTYVFVAVYTLVVVALIYVSVAYLIGYIPGVLVGLLASLLPGVDNGDFFARATPLVVVAGGGVVVVGWLVLRVNHSLRTDPLRERAKRMAQRIADEWNGAGERRPSSRRRANRRRSLRARIGTATRGTDTRRRSRVSDPPMRRSREPRRGWRAWSIMPDTIQEGPDMFPVLGSISAAAIWDTNEMLATCRPLSRDRGEPHDRTPEISCTCGVYAVKKLADVATPWPGLVAYGEVDLAGRVIEGSRGYRAELARLAGPLTIRANCSGGGIYVPCRRRAVFVAEDDGRFHAECQRHNCGGSLHGGPTYLVDDFMQMIRARLELRYGVDVLIDKGERPWT